MASNGYPQQGENATTQNTTASQQSPDQVGWYFVEQYYTILGKSPEQISLFYNKKSLSVWGTEGDVQPMLQGRNEISERFKALNFKDCKVRVTNVDSQTSANNGILIQVMGEMIIDQGPCKRFVQTFFLAEQVNGYFVLNDVFRYLKEEDEDALVEENAEEEVPPEVEEEAAVELEPEPVPVEEEAAPVEEPVQEPEETNIATEVEPEPEQVKPEEPIKIAPAVPEIPAAVPTIVEATNGTPAEQDSKPEKTVDEPQAVPEPVEEAPASPAPQVDTAVEISAEPTPVPTPPPQPTPAEKPPVAAPPPALAPVPQPVAAPPKPLTWASLLNTKPASAAAPAPQVTQPPPPPPPPQQPQPPASQPAQASQSNAAATATTPTSSSSGQGWQSVSENSRRHGRPTSIANSGDLQNQAYVKNVTESVDINALKDALAKFGTIKSFEVNKSKNCAFVEFDSAASIKSAKNAGPILIGNQTIQVEERRAPVGRVGGGPGYGPRSPAMGPRGGDSRQGGQRGGGGGGFQRVEGRFDNRDGRDGGRGGSRGGSGRGYPSRGRGGAAATN